MNKEIRKKRRPQHKIALAVLQLCRLRKTEGGPSRTEITKVTGGKKVTERIIKALIDFNAIKIENKLNGDKYERAEEDGFISKVPSFNMISELLKYRSDFFFLK